MKHKRSSKLFPGEEPVRKALVIMAHPDDEVLGCGGTMAKLVASGVDVKAIILATGVTSRFDDERGHEEEVRKVYQDAQRANGFLGLPKKNVSFLSFPDQRLDAVPILDIIKPLRDLRDSYNPDIVFTHSRNDYNTDHQVVFDAVLMAFRPAYGEPTPKLILACEVLSSSEWSWQQTYPFMPQHYIVLDKKQVKQKQDALGAYKTELRPYPHPRSKRGVEILARKRGMEVGKEFAEAFMVVRKITW